MRKIKSDAIKETVSHLCIQANLVLRKDIFLALERAYRSEKNKRAKGILKILLDNASIAKKEKLPICQDTGMAVVFVEIGNRVKITGGNLEEAINAGVREGYQKGYLRKSVCEPFSRRNTRDNSPAVIHSRMVKGEKLKISVCIKGFGAENKSQVKMFEPTAAVKEIKDFIIRVVKDAGPDACPPFVVGVGIGGTADYAMFLSKKALLKKITNYRLPITDYVSKLECDLLKEINNLNIGPMGLGGKTTALGVNILTYPTHIAGLPVAVNLSCHAARSATKTI